MALGLAISGVFVYRRFGAFWPWGTAMRVALSGAAVVALGRLALPDAGRLVTLGSCVLVLVAYFAVLSLLGEFKSADLSDLKKIVRRG